MEEIIAWLITSVFVFVIGCVCGRSSHRRTGDGTGSDADRVRDNLKGTADDNRRLADDNRRAGELNRTAADENQRAQNLVRRARDILDEAKHTDSDN